MFRLETTWTTDKNNLYLVRGLTRPRFFWVDLIRRRARASSPVRYAVRHLILTPLSASVPLCLCVNFITETQRHRVFFIFLCPSAPLPLCVKNILLQSRDSFPNLVNPVNPVKKVRLSVSVPLCLCVNFITETQRHRVFFILSLPLCSFAPLR